MALGLNIRCAISILVASYLVHELQTNQPLLKQIMVQKVVQYSARYKPPKARKPTEGTLSHCNNT